jgi:hypothetical protein
MVANIRAAKEIRMHLGGYLRCNPSNKNAIGVETVTTQI